jgi:predicted amidohydrolase
MNSFIAAACQVPAGVDPRETAVKAAAAGARLVVLPPFSLERAPAPAAGGSGPARPGREELLAAASSIAKAAGCFLVPGTVTIPAPDGEGLQAVAWLLSPRGKLIGEQGQTHTTREEEAAGLVRSSKVDVFDIEGVGIGLLVGLDAWVPEVSRILVLDGAVILAAPLAMPAPYSEGRQLAGLWQEVQQNQVFGVEACLVGPLSGREYAGLSAVTGPCEMTPDDSGFIVRAPSAGGSLTLLGAIDLKARERVVAAYDVFGELNVGIYRRAFPAAYYRLRERRREE